MSHCVVSIALWHAGRHLSSSHFPIHIAVGTEHSLASGIQYTEEKKGIHHSTLKLELGIQSPILQITSADLKPQTKKEKKKIILENLFSHVQRNHSNFEGHMLVIRFTAVSTIVHYVIESAQSRITKTSPQKICSKTTRNAVREWVAHTHPPVIK